MLEDAKKRNEKESDFTRNKQKTQVSLDVAMGELGLDN
tara:strand:- start:6619 stop:6732 length:114 start_codon:yes stop_codon:yes gene_type:complete